MCKHQSGTIDHHNGVIVWRGQGRHDNVPSHVKSRNLDVRTYLLFNFFETAGLTNVKFGKIDYQPKVGVTKGLMTSQTKIQFLEIAFFDKGKPF